MRRREFIAGLGSAAALPVVARAQQQGDRVRRIGVLLPGDENGPFAELGHPALTQALEGFGWTDGRNVGWTFVGAVVTSIGCERLRRNWSVCNPTSS